MPETRHSVFKETESSHETELGEVVTRQLQLKTVAGLTFINRKKQA